MENTVLIALITALAAIVAPVITAWINNRYNLNCKRIEASQEKIKDINLHEREVLEKALSGMGILLSNCRDRDSVQEACKNMLTAVAYVDISTGEKLRSIVSSVMASSKELSLKEYSEICNIMKLEIEKRTYYLLK